MLATTSTNAANIHMYKNPGYDPEKDFQVVGVIGSSGAFLVVPADSPLQVAGRPARLRQGQSRQAELRLLQCQLPGAGRRCWASKAGVEWQGVAYKAIGNAWTDLYAGAIQFMFVDLTAARGQVVAKQGAAAGDHAARAQPALSRRCRRWARPSPASSAPASSRSPCRRRRREPIKERLNALINEAIFSPEIHKRLVNEFALDAAPLDLAQCAAQDREERAKWAEYVKIARIEPQ